MWCMLSCCDICGRWFGSNRTSWIEKRRRTKTSIDKSKLFTGDHGVVPCICSRQGICSSSSTCCLDLLSKIDILRKSDAMCDQNFFSALVIRWVKKVCLLYWQGTICCHRFSKNETITVHYYLRHVNALLLIQAREPKNSRRCLCHSLFCSNIFKIIDSCTRNSYYFSLVSQFFTSTK